MFSISKPYLASAFDLEGLLFSDIRELVSLEDVMEELGLGPNGGLVYCMEYPLHYVIVFHFSS